ncbi:hypothetical protein JXA40_12605 [bacterium]|nr:hypothetical protein [candidate division CSSED10-310 bacterium]
MKSHFALLLTPSVLILSVLMMVTGSVRADTARGPGILQNTELVIVSDFQPDKYPGFDDQPGDPIETFNIDWAENPKGLCYYPPANYVQFAHDGGEGRASMYNIDTMAGHVVINTIQFSDVNPEWPSTLDPKDGVGFDPIAGTFFAVDLNGDGGTTREDYIIEYDTTGLISNGWETDGIGNDSSDGSAIDRITDIAVVPGSPPRFFVTSVVSTEVTEIALIRSGMWVDDTWSTVTSWPVTDITLPYGIDYDAQNGVLYVADFESTNISAVDLSGTFLGSFRCSAGVYNTGVTFVEGAPVPEVWVMDPESTQCKRCQAFSFATPTPTPTTTSPPPTDTPAGPSPTPSHTPSEPTPTPDLGVELSPDLVEDLECYDFTYFVDFTVANYTGIEDSFDISYISDWPISGPATIGPIPYGEMDIFTCSITLDTRDNIVSEITVTSQTNPMYTDTSYVDLTATNHEMLLGESMPHARGYHALVCEGTNFWALGGSDTEGLVDAVEKYNLSTDSWDPGTVWSTPLTYIDAVFYGEQIFIPGGYNLTTFETTTYTYETASGTWSTTHPALTANAGYSTTLFAGEIYRIGGSPLSTWPDPQRQFAKMNPAMGWTPLSPCWTKRLWSAFGTVGDVLVVAGGFDGTTAVGATEFWRTSIEQWDTGVNMPVPVYAAADAVFEGKLWVLGGIDGSGNERDIIQTYNPGTNTWTVEAIKLIQPRAYFDADATEQRIVVTGGWYPNTVVHDLTEVIVPCGAAPTPPPTFTPPPPPTDTPLGTNTPTPITPTQNPTETFPPTPTHGPPTNTPVIPTNTPVPPPTNTPVIPTNTPVIPTNTPVVPTNTPSCDVLGCEIYMPQTVFRAGDECYCDVYICNPGSETYQNIPVFVILDVYGWYFFAPSFEEFDFYQMNIVPGLTTINVLPSFTWPSGVGSAFGILWYAGMTDPGITQLFGEYGIFTFGWM